MNIPQNHQAKPQISSLTGFLEKAPAIPASGSSVSRSREKPSVWAYWSKHVQHCLFTGATCSTAVGGTRLAGLHSLTGELCAGNVPRPIYFHYKLTGQTSQAEAPDKNMSWKLERDWCLTLNKSVFTFCLSPVSVCMQQEWVLKNSLNNSWTFWSWIL